MKLGYRQKALLAVLRDRPLPFGYLCRVTGIEDGKTAFIALKGLERRGLVVHVRHGYWALAA